MAIELPPLPYDRTALEPHLSGETVDFHYGKHHKSCADTLNTLIEGTEFATLSLEDIVRKSQGGIFNNAAQLWNNTFYWNCLRPASGRSAGGGEPTGRLAERIDQAFGDFSLFKQEFSRAAIGIFGAGWCWLVQRPDRTLGLACTTNAATPLTGEDTPLLAVSVWEHAYYIDYRNARPKYIESFWALVNWDFVADRLA